MNRFPAAVGAAAYRISAAADLSVSDQLGAPCPIYLAGARVSAALEEVLALGIPRHPRDLRIPGT